MRSRERLFRVIVVVGAAGATVAACAGKSTSSGPAVENRAGSSGTTTRGGSDAEDIAEPGSLGTVNLGGGGGGGGTGGLVESQGGAIDSDGEGGATWTGPCEHSQQYVCVSTREGMDCSCDTAAPLSSEDCSSTRMFVCKSYDPPTGCECALVTGPQ
jgi:hypothetical protein